MARRRPSAASRGPSRSRLGLGGPSGGRLGRQEARRKAVLAVGTSGPPGGQNAGFATVLLQNAGFAQTAGRAQAGVRLRNVTMALKPKAPSRKA